MRNPKADDVDIAKEVLPAITSSVATMNCAHVNGIVGVMDVCAVVASSWSLLLFFDEAFLGSCLLTL